MALDDFGTGYSSLSYLRDLPLNVLKIDKSFIDNIDHQQSKELVRSIIAIGKHMKLLTVAEGTESKEQVEMLKEMGCDYFQAILKASSENYIKDFHSKYSAHWVL